MSSLPQLNAVVQQGRGVVASILGNGYNVFRLGSAVSGSITNQAPTIAGYLAKLEKAKKKDIEANTFDLEVFEAKCDNTALRIGDILVGTSAADPATYAFAQYRDLRPTLFVRTEYSGVITRPGGSVGTIAEQPTSGAVADSGWLGASRASGSTPTSDAGLTLTDGVYAFGTGTAAVVPVGLSQTRRMRDSQNPQIPSAEYRDDYVAYVPLLPGVELRQLDRIDLGTYGQYQIGSFLSSAANAGLAGYILILEKLPS